MKLHNGLDVTISGQIQVENNNYVVVKLPHATYMQGLLVTHVLCRQHNFVEYSEQAKKESDEITKFDPIVPDVVKEATIVAENTTEEQSSNVVD
jgi:hypothetical protein